MTTKTLPLFAGNAVGQIPYDIAPSHYQTFYRTDIPVAFYEKPALNIAEVDLPVKRETSNQHKSKMKKAIKYINCHLTNNLSLDDVADHVNLSPCYFSKLFKKQQGIGFNLYVNQQRMKQAKLLLDMPELSIATVAKNLGFSQTSYFCRLFRQIYQITPQTYRNQH